MAYGGILGQSAPSVDFSGVGNLYVWKVSSVNEGTPTEYNSGHGTAVFRWSGTGTINTPQTYYYSDSLIGLMTGINRKGPYSVLYGELSGAMSTLRGKYVYAPDSWKSWYFYIYENATTSSGQETGISPPAYSNWVVPVRLYNDASIISEGYITSDNPDAYPQNGIVGEKLYEYVGQVGDGTRSVVGSYVGNGQYGSSNRNTLSFDFEPNFLFVQQSNGAYYMVVVRDSNTAYQDMPGSTGGSTISVIWSEKEVSWYSSGGQSVQMNSSGVVYNYIAFG